MDAIQTLINSILANMVVYMGLIWDHAKIYVLCIFGLSLGIIVISNLSGGRIKIADDDDDDDEN
jgi:hypothetical protein